MPVIKQRMPWMRQPQAPAMVNWNNQCLQGLKWMTTTTGSFPFATMRNEVTGENATTLYAGNTFNPVVCSVGRGGGQTLNTANSTSVYFKYISKSYGLLHGATGFTLIFSGVFSSNVLSMQSDHMRVDNKHSLVIYSSTSSSINWGADWETAWNGASQQTLNLANSQPFTIGASINSSGARFFANGKFVGTKSGSSFTLSTSANQTWIISGTAQIYEQSMAISRALSDTEMAFITNNNNLNRYSIFNP